MAEDPRMRAAELRRQADSLRQEIQDLKHRVDTLQKEAHDESLKKKNEASIKQRMAGNQNLTAAQRAEILREAGVATKDSVNIADHAGKEREQLDSAIKQKERDLIDLDSLVRRLETEAPGALPF